VRHEFQEAKKRIHARKICRKELEEMYRYMPLNLSK
jgi:hypothetical protein